MLLFVKGAQNKEEMIPVSELLDEIGQTLEPHAIALSVALKIVPVSPELKLTGERQAITGALINLLENALQACRVGGSVSLTVGGDGSPFAAFIVEDNGSGIPDAAREHLFEPFFTTRGEGSGLGLAIVRQVAEAHGGWVDWSAIESGGSRFALYLPFHGRESPHD